MSIRWAEEDGSELLNSVDVPETLTLESYLNFSIPLINHYRDEKGLEGFLEEMSRALPEVFTFSTIVDECKKKYVLKKDAVIMQIEYKDEEIIMDSASLNLDYKSPFINKNQSRMSRGLSRERNNEFDTGNNETISEKDFRPERSCHRSRYYQTQPKWNRHILVTVTPQVDPSEADFVPPTSYWKGYILMTEDPDTPNNVLLKLVKSTLDQDAIEWEDGLGQFSTWEEDQPSPDYCSSYSDTESTDDADPSIESNKRRGAKRTFPRERRDHRSFHSRIQSSASIVKINKELNNSYKSPNSSTSNSDVEVDNDAGMPYLKRSVSKFDLTASTERSSSHINYQPRKTQRIGRKRPADESTSESLTDTSLNFTTCDDSEIESSGSDTSLETVKPNPNFHGEDTLSPCSSDFETNENEDFDEDNEDFNETNDADYEFDNHWLEESEECITKNDEDGAYWLEEEALATAIQFDGRQYEQPSNSSSSEGQELFESNPSLNESTYRNAVRQVQPFIFKATLDARLTTPFAKVDFNAVIPPTNSNFEIVKTPIQTQIVNEKDLTNETADIATKLFSSNCELLEQENSTDRNNDSKILINDVSTCDVDYTRAIESCSDFKEINNSLKTEVNPLSWTAIANILISKDKKKVERARQIEISDLCEQIENPSSKVSVGNSNKFDDDISHCTSQNLIIPIEKSKTNSGITFESLKKCSICDYLKDLEPKNRQEINHSVQNLGECYVIHSNQKQLLHKELELFERKPLLKRKYFRRILTSVKEKLIDLNDCPANHDSSTKEDLMIYQKETFRVQTKIHDSMNETEIITNITERYTSRTLCKQKHHLPIEKCIDKLYRKCLPNGNSMEVHHKKYPRKDQGVYNRIMMTKRSIQKEKCPTKSNQRVHFFYYHKCENISERLVGRRQRRKLVKFLVNGGGLSSIPNFVNDPECEISLIKYDNYRCSVNKTQTLFSSKIINTIFKRNRFAQKKRCIGYKVAYKFINVKHKSKYRVLVTTETLLSGWEIDKSVDDSGHTTETCVSFTNPDDVSLQKFHVRKMCKDIIAVILLLLKTVYLGTKAVAYNVISGKYIKICVPSCKDYSTEDSPQHASSLDLFSDEDTDTAVDASKIPIGLPKTIETSSLKDLKRHNPLSQSLGDSKSLCNSNTYKTELMNRFLDDCLKHLPPNLGADWANSQEEENHDNSIDRSFEYDDVTSYDESVNFIEVD